MAQFLHGHLFKPRICFICTWNSDLNITERNQIVEEYKWSSRRAMCTNGFDLTLKNTDTKSILKLFWICKVNEFRCVHWIFYIKKELERELIRIRNIWNELY
jgi:hypothetical protein